MCFILIISEFPWWRHIWADGVIGRWRRGWMVRQLRETPVCLQTSVQHRQTAKLVVLSLTTCRCVSWVSCHDSDGPIGPTARHPQNICISAHTHSLQLVSVSQQLDPLTSGFSTGLSLLFQTLLYLQLCLQLRPDLFQTIPLTTTTWFLCLNQTTH